MLLYFFSLLIWTEVKSYSTQMYRADLAGGIINARNLTDTLLIDEMIIDISENKWVADEMIS